MKILIFLLLSTFSLPLLAERLFDIEVIIFKHNTPNDQIEEQWADTPPALSLSGALAVSNRSALERAGVQILPKSDWKLGNIYSKLAQNKNYTPLVQLAWRQVDGDRTQMPKIRISDGNDFASRYNQDGTAIEGLSQQSSPLLTLDGFLQVYVQHYLFVNADLILREEVQRKIPKPLEEVRVSPSRTEREAQLEQQLDIYSQRNFQEIDQSYESTDLESEMTASDFIWEDFLRTYELKENRRMISGDIHYIDHPKLGLIIQARRAS